MRSSVAGSYLNGALFDFFRTSLSCKTNHIAMSTAVELSLNSNCQLVGDCLIIFH